MKCFFFSFMLKTCSAQVGCKIGCAGNHCRDHVECYLEHNLNVPDHFLFMLTAAQACKIWISQNQSF